jgi:hypothetical protein
MVGDMARMFGVTTVHGRKSAPSGCLNGYELPFHLLLGSAQRQQPIRMVREHAVDTEGEEPSHF